MTADVIAIKPQSLNALITQAKAAWDRAEAKKEDADDWLIRTGKLLVDLKAKAKDDGERWLDVVKKLGRSPRRAQELMRLATGDDIPETQRERNRKSKKAARAKKKKYAGRPAHSEPPEHDDEDAEPGDGAPEFWQRSLANLCGDVLARRALWTRMYPDWKTYECPSHVQTLVREAATEFAALAAVVAKMGDRK